MPHRQALGLASSGRLVRASALAIGVAALSSCTSLGSSGPATSDVSKLANTSASSAKIAVVDLDMQTAQRIIQTSATVSMADSLGDGFPFGSIVGNGDVLDVTIWEAPPATLFGASVSDARQIASNPTAKTTTLPEQMVDSKGRITLPFVGQLVVAGQTPAEIESDIAHRLQGIAHKPQVVVRVVRNTTASVTVVGDTANSARIPLTPKGERLLDVIAAVGGVKQPVGKITIQVSRGGKTVSQPLEQIISNPRQNIRLQADDVVTALYQPFSFTALGAIGNNAEIAFEATGITLAQALGRMGGLRDERANVRGVFLFRLEDPTALDPKLALAALKTADGRVPVIYRIDLKDPTSFFLAQGFPIKNKDVLFVSNAPGADIQKFVNMVSSMAFSVIGISNSL